MVNQKYRIKFNVGGRIFETTSMILANAGRNSFFGAMFDGNWNQRPIYPEEHFIDRNPDCFAVLLDLLRTGKLYIPSNVHEKSLYIEAQFYGLLDQIKAAKWGAFDANRLHLAQSMVKCRVANDSIIRASPDGGCCVANGPLVRVYDWMLEEHPPINLDYQGVNDAIWVDPENVVISFINEMGLFNALTGELRYRFRETQEVKGGYKCGVLGFNSDYKLFSSCRSSSDRHGIAVWDQVTGKQVDFFDETPLGPPLSKACRLQWLSGTNCLFVANVFPCHISLLDFRDKKMVCSRVDTGRSTTDNGRKVTDVIVMEERSKICLVNNNEDFQFIDMKSLGGLVEFYSPKKSTFRRNPCYPKLALHGGNLLSSVDDTISVYRGPDSIFSSSLKNSQGGAICDFSIGGDRLFALHNRYSEIIFNVWETWPYQF